MQKINKSSSLRFYSNNANTFLHHMYLWKDFLRTISTSMWLGKRVLSPFCGWGQLRLTDLLSHVSRWRFQAFHLGIHIHISPPEERLSTLSIMSSQSCPLKVTGKPPARKNILRDRTYLVFPWSQSKRSKNRGAQKTGKSNDGTQSPWPGWVSRGLDNLLQGRHTASSPTAGSSLSIKPLLCARLWEADCTWTAV